MKVDLAYGSCVENRLQFPCSHKMINWSNYLVAQLFLIYCSRHTLPRDLFLIYILNDTFELFRSAKRIQVCMLLVSLPYSIVEIYVNILSM